MKVQYVNFDLVMHVLLTAKNGLRRARHDNLAAAVEFIALTLRDSRDELLEDAVPAKEHDLLVRRLEHLLESDYIRSFDEKDIMTGKYKRDIRDADRENHRGRWINESHGYRNCSECGCEHPILDANGFHLDDRYCPDCGAKMK